jgi:hypothetical protein
MEKKMLKIKYVKETTIRAALIELGYHVPDKPYIDSPSTKNVHELLPFDLIEGKDNIILEDKVKNNF